MTGLGSLPGGFCLLCRNNSYREGWCLHRAVSKPWEQASSLRVLGLGRPGCWVEVRAGPEGRTEARPGLM